MEDGGAMKKNIYIQSGTVPLCQVAKWDSATEKSVLLGKKSEKGKEEPKAEKEEKGKGAEASQEESESPESPES